MVAEQLEQIEQELLKTERRELLEQIEEWFESPMLVLGFVWLVLLVVEFLYGLTPFLELLTTAIWGLFLVDFALRFTLAPDKSDYLKGNWLTVISLLLPAFRIFRIGRVLRWLQTVRGVRVVRVVGTLNRGMRALSRTMTRRGVGYLAALTLIVALVGAAGIYAFEAEKAAGAEALPNYGAALWWTLMLMTTMGSDYWPQSAEGRMLTVLLSIYSLAVVGYLTAAMASYFIGRDAASSEAEVVGGEAVAALHAEIVALRAEVQALAGALAPRDPAGD